MQALPAALHAMGAYRQFIVYKTEPNPLKPGKTNKFPVCATPGPDYGAVVSAHDRANWLGFDEAAAAAARMGGAHGVGFVFTDGDPFWFLDIDDCLDAGGQWSALAQSLCARLAGAAVEVSQSGRGLHIFGCGALPDHGCKNIKLGIELYHTGRFVALTGLHATGNIYQDFSAHMAAVVAEFFPPGIEGERPDWAEGPVAGYKGPTDDAELLRLMLSSKSMAAAFGGKASAHELWEGDVDALARAFPDPHRAYDASSADIALAQHLAFWTGNDCARMERLMRQSALVRDKWNAREDYLQRTIITACSRQKKFAEVKAPAPAPAPAPADGAAPGYSSYLLTSDFDAYFKGCVYIVNRHRVLLPNGTMVSPDRFKVLYGGKEFKHHDHIKPTRDAWEAFTNATNWRCPVADQTCFRPELPEGELIVEGNLVLVNTWVDPRMPRQAGDVSPFTGLLQRLIPNEQDRRILVAWMASLVRNPGKKFFWAPLIQGAEGNGKTFLLEALERCVGPQYCWRPKAEHVTKQFNSWMADRLLIGVEEVCLRGRHEMQETLKDWITNDRGQIEAKGADQVMSDLRANWFFLTNHKDAVVKSANDRRYAMFFTAQQTAEDIVRDGLGGDYLPRLYRWLKHEGGGAIVNDWLRTVEIPPELDPAGACHRAPITSSTAEAIALSAGPIEQEIAEAIEQGRPGFRGGWISSMMLDRLLSEMGGLRKPQRAKRLEILTKMGYMKHPGLIDGRVNDPVTSPDMGKPRLFVRPDSAEAALVGAAVIRVAYETAQIAP